MKPTPAQRFLLKFRGRFHFNKTVRASSLVFWFRFMLKTPGQLKNFEAPNIFLKDGIYVLKRINIFDGINFMFRF